MHIYTYLQKIDGWMDRWIDTYACTLSTYTVVEHTYIYIYTYIHTYIHGMEAYGRFAIIQARLLGNPAQVPALSVALVLQQLRQRADAAESLFKLVLVSPRCWACSVG